MSYGRYFEELEPGQEFRHWPGRTITEFDDTLFSLMSMNQHPLHNDEHFASKTQHGRRLVGWDEILEGGVPEDAIVMSWRGADGAIHAAAAGHDTVLQARAVGIVELILLAQPEQG